MSTFQITLFIAAAVAGGAVSQLPLGRLSDHYDRRLVVIGAATVAGAVAVALAFGAALPTPALIALSFGFGAFVMPLYALAVAHANDRAAPEDFVVMGSGVLMLFGLGSAVGAPLAGVVMAWAGSSALFAFVAAVLAVLVVGVARRRRVRTTPVHVEAEQPFVAVAEFAPLPLDLDPRAEPAGQTSSVPGRADVCPE